MAPAVTPAIQPSCICIQCHSISSVRYFTVPDFFYCSYCCFSIRRTYIENILFDFSNYVRNSSAFNSSSLCISCDSRNVLSFNSRYVACNECKVVIIIDKLLGMEGTAQKTVLYENIFNSVFQFTGA